MQQYLVRIMVVIYYFYSEKHSEVIFCGEILSHANLLCRAHHYYVERGRLIHLVGWGIAGWIVK